MFVLTFANMEDCERKDDRDEDNTDEEPDDDDEKRWKELQKQSFQGRIKTWEESLKNFSLLKLK